MCAPIPPLIRSDPCLPRAALRGHRLIPSPTRTAKLLVPSDPAPRASRHAGSPPVHLGGHQTNIVPEPRVHAQSASAVDAFRGPGSGRLPPNRHPAAVRSASPEPFERPDPEPLVPGDREDDHRDPDCEGE